MLKELEEFAFKGCADLSEIKRQRLLSEETGELEENISRQKERQLALLSQLKEQLEDLEKFAYETGEGGLPSSQVIAKQVGVLRSAFKRFGR